MIKAFLSDNHWQKQDLDTFLNDWKGLTAEERTEATSSARFNQMANAIQKKIMEENALIALGDNEAAIAKRQSLIDFAKSIGVRDPKILSLAK